MKPIRKMRLFAAALTVACLLAATVRTVAAGRGKAVLTGVVYGDGAPLAGVCVSDGVQFATTDAAGRYRIESDKVGGLRLRRHAVGLGRCRGRRRPAAFLGGARRGGCP